MVDKNNNKDIEFSLFRQLKKNLVFSGLVSMSVIIYQGMMTSIGYNFLISRFSSYYILLLTVAELMDMVENHQNYRHLLGGFLFHISITIVFFFFLFLSYQVILNESIIPN